MTARTLLRQMIADPIDIGAEQRRVDLWSLEQAREGLADAIARRLPVSTEMYREQVARLEERLVRTSRPEAVENVQ